MDDFRNEIEKIDDNIQITGKEVKAMLNAILDYAIFEVELKERQCNLRIKLIKLE